MTRILTFLLATLLLASAANGATVYMAAATDTPAGVDTNDGSAGAPVLSMYKAKTLCTDNTNTVYVKGGVIHVAGNRCTMVSGDSITFIGYGTTVDDGQVATLTTGTIDFPIYDDATAATDTVWLKNLSLASDTDGALTGIILVNTGASGTWKLTNCTFTIPDGTSGYCFRQDATAGDAHPQILFDDCTFTHAGTGTNVPMILIAGACTLFEMYDCTIDGNKTGVQGLSFNGTTTNVIMKRNSISTNKACIVFGTNFESNAVTIQDNPVITCATEGGLSIDQYDVGCSFIFERNVVTVAGAGVRVGTDGVLVAGDAGTTVTFTNGTGTVNYTGHSLADGTRVMFTNSGGAVPSGLTASYPYYTKSTGADTFLLYYDVGLTSQAAFTTDGTGTTKCFLAKLVEEATGYDPFKYVRINGNTITKTGTAAGHGLMVGAAVVGAEVAYNKIVWSNNDYCLVTKGSNILAHHNAIYGRYCITNTRGSYNRYQHNSCYGIGVGPVVQYGQNNGGGQDLLYPSHAIFTDNIFDASGSGATYCYQSSTYTAPYGGGDFHRHFVFDRNLLIPGASGVAYLNGSARGASGTTAARLAEVQAAWAETNWDDVTATGNTTNDTYSEVATSASFMNASAGDLRIRPGSPAEGLKSGAPTLYLWNDIGAWQRKGGGTGRIDW